MGLQSASACNWAANSRANVVEAEAASARLAAQCSALDLAMAEPARAATEFANVPMSEMSRRRAKAAADLADAEAKWLEVNEQLERLAA